MVDAIAEPEPLRERDRRVVELGDDLDRPHLRPSLRREEARRAAEPRAEVEDARTRLETDPVRESDCRFELPHVQLVDRGEAPGCTAEPRGFRPLRGELAQHGRTPVFPMITYG